MPSLEIARSARKQIPRKHPRVTRFGFLSGDPLSEWERAYRLSAFESRRQLHQTAVPWSRNQPLKRPFTQFHWQMPAADALGTAQQHAQRLCALCSAALVKLGMLAVVAQPLDRRCGWSRLAPPHSTAHLEPRQKPFGTERRPGTVPRPVFAAHLSGLLVKAF